MVDYRAVEVSSPEKDRDVWDFMVAIAGTSIMRAAYEYVKARLHRGS